MYMATVSIAVLCWWWCRWLFHLVCRSRGSAKQSSFQCWCGWFITCCPPPSVPFLSFGDAMFSTLFFVFYRPKYYCYYSFSKAKDLVNLDQFVSVGNREEWLKLCLARLCFSYSVWHLLLTRPRHRAYDVCHVILLTRHSAYAVPLGLKLPLSTTAYNSPG